MSRWQIQTPKRRIVSYNFDNHLDDIELSGEKVSGIIKYGIKDNTLIMDRHIVYPMFRLQPDVTQSSYQLDINEKIFSFEENFVKVEIDGILHIYTQTIDLNIVHHFYPSTTLPIFYEQIEVENKTNEIKKIDYEMYKKISVVLCCEGYVYIEKSCDKNLEYINPGEKVSLTFVFSARYVNDKIPHEENSYEKRVERINTLLTECDFTSGNDVVDTMFAFSKIRAGESIFNTKKGRVHSPGGTNYYAAIWCNDQCEYSTPWFGFTGDDILNDAAINAIEWFEPYMTDELLPIPSSIISEGTDYWNGAGDRGDASMFLFGTSRFMLETGMTINSKVGKLLEWAYNYVKSRINDDNVVVSDTDELEGRLSSGINLSTSSLSYGGFMYYAELLKRDGMEAKAEESIALALRVKNGIENYFGGEISGYNTYHYHSGCKDIRSWLCLPLYMGIDNRKDDTIKAIDQKLWKDGSCLSTENERIMWDRSAMYYITSMFKCGYNEMAFSKLIEMSNKRLLGDRVPYVVEAYPENGMRHLSAESALFCRIIVDGLVGIDFKDGVKVTPHLPKGIQEFSLKNIILDGKKVDIYYKENKVIII